MIGLDMIGIPPIVALILLVVVIVVPIGFVVLLIRAWPSSPTGDPQRQNSNRIGGRLE
jgi:hypothetical protein